MLNEGQHGGKKMGLELLHPIIQPKPSEGHIFTRSKTDFKNFVDISSSNPLDWSFEQLSDFYQKVNTICMSNALGVIYNPSTYDSRRIMKDKLHSEGFRVVGVGYRGAKVNQIMCGKMHCDRCRPLLKYRLKLEIEKAMLEHKLYTHFVVTTEGTKYRDKNDYIQSYYDMSKTWNKIRKILSNYAKKEGKRFTYICLPRAQKNGYCHLHVMTNLYIPKQMLQDISKLYFNTGWIKVKAIQNQKRLSSYFLKDHEWYIPFGRRHYFCSRDIELDMDIEDIPEDCMHIRLEPDISVVDQVYEQIELNYGYPPPFDFLLSHYVQNNKKKFESKEKEYDYRCGWCGYRFTRLCEVTNCVECGSTHIELIAHQPLTRLHTPIGGKDNPLFTLYVDTMKDKRMFMSSAADPLFPCRLKQPPAGYVSFACGDFKQQWDKYQKKKRKELFES